MLGIELAQADALRRAWQVVDWSVPFAERNHLLASDLGQYLAKAPNAASIRGFKRTTPIAPQFLQRRRIEPARTTLPPAGVGDFEKVVTMLAAKPVGECDSAAPNAAQFRDTPISFDCLFSHFGENLWAKE